MIRRRSYCELFSSRTFSHVIYVDQAPLQDYLHARDARQAWLRLQAINFLHAVREEARQRLATLKQVRRVQTYDDLIEAGSMAAAKAAGKVRMEGKEYVMADGDVVEFRFNV